jgi:hypothetical protein
MPDEIIIADDGSGKETKELVDTYRLKFKVPLLHIWQPDDGYQLAKIRNKAFAAASKDYIIQIDGDLILHRYFIYDHLRVCNDGTFVTGTRALLDEEISKQLLDSGDHRFSKKNLAKVEKVHNALRIKAFSLVAYHFQGSEKSMYKVLGCNMAFWKKDLLKVNGYNEEFVGWGKEDNDIAIRLTNSGVKQKFLKFGAIVYHLYHKETARDLKEINEKLFKKSIANKKSYIEKGIDKHLSEKVN